MRCKDKVVVLAGCRPACPRWGRGGGGPLLGSWEIRALEQHREKEIMDATPRVMEAQQVSPLTKKPYAYGLPSPLIASKGFAPSHAAAMRESTHFEAELPYFSSAIARSAADTQAFAAELSGLTPLHAHKPPKGKGQELFDHFDVDGSGALGFDEVLLGVKAFGLQVSEPSEVRALFDASDKDGSGVIDLNEFEHVVEGVAGLRQGRAIDAERLASAARTLHAQALSAPLELVAEGEVPTLLRCAASGHAAVEQLGLAGLAVVAEAPHADCASAIVARAQALGAVLAALNRPDARIASVRQGARLLAALCREPGEAREVEARRRLRVRLFDLAGPLLHGAFGKRCAGLATSTAAYGGKVAMAAVEESSHAGDGSQSALCLALCLAAFASEPELAARMSNEAGGGALQLMVTLAGSADSSTRHAAVDAICSCVTCAAAAKERRDLELGTGGWSAIDEGKESSALWKFVGFGALSPLLLAASVPCSAPGEPPVADMARKALALLKYESLWKGAGKETDPLYGHHRA